MLKVLSFILLLVPSLSFAACEAEMAQYDMNHCSGLEFKKADKKLNRVYEDLYKKLERQEDKAALKWAQNYWIKYRDAQCRFSTTGTDGGSVHGMVLSQCLEELTEYQIKVLEEQLHCQEGDLGCGGH